MEGQFKTQLESAPTSWRKILESFDTSNATGVGVKRKVRASTRLFYLKVVVRFARIMNKPLDAVTVEDLKDYISSVDNKFTQRHTCATLKKFFKFAGRKDLADLISIPSISLSEHKNEIDRISAEEVKQLLTAEDNARNQALIAVLYESAGRLSEVLALKIKDVTLDKYGAIVKLYGKTELRNLRLVAAAPYLTRWLGLHAYKSNPEAPIFYTHGHTHKGEIKALGKTMMAKVIWNVARKAGFKDVKKFHPHAFRHGRLSELGHSLSDSELKFVGGWSDEARRMISLYSHMDENRVNGKLLSLQGLAPEEEKRVAELQVKACPRCKALAATTSLYCNVCGLPLTTEGLKALEKEGPEMYKTLFKAFFSMAECLNVDLSNLPGVDKLQIERLKEKFRPQSKEEVPASE